MPVLNLDAGCVKVAPKGLLTFLGFLGNAEFSPWKRLPESEVTHTHTKKFAGVFVTASDDFLGFCLENIVCAIPVRVMKDQY